MISKFWIATHGADTLIRTIGHCYDIDLGGLASARLRIGQIVRGSRKRQTANPVRIAC